MSFFTELWQHPAVETLGWTLLHFVWQGVLVASGLALALGILRRASANARYLAGLVALFLAAALPIGTAAWIGLPKATQAATEDASIAEHTESPIPEVAESMSRNAELPSVMDPPLLPANGIPPQMTNQPTTKAPLPVTENAVAVEPASTQDEVTSAAVESTLSDRLRPFLPYAVGLWVLGVAIFSLRLLLTWVRVQRLRVVGVHPLTSPLSDGLSPLCQRLGIRRKVLLLCSWRVEVPTVIGWLKPVVLFPMSALAGLTPLQLEALLAHELAHIRRWDYAVNLLQTVIETVLFYHPAVWWISRRIRAERENCCDDWAAKISGDEAGYVRALLHIAELHLAQNRIAVAAGDGDLLERAKRLLSRSNERRFAPGSGGVLLTAVMLGLLAAGLFQIAWAEPDQEKEIPEDTKAAASEVDYKSLNPEKIASEVEAVMQRFSKVSYKATFEETHNTNAFVKEEVLPVSGKGGWTYKSDGSRWLIAQDGFTYTVGAADAIPTHTIAGFDGQRYFQTERESFVIGEDPLTNDVLVPKSVFWKGGRTVDWFLAALKSWNAKIDREATIDGRTCIVLVSEPGQPKTPQIVDGKVDQPTLWQYEITLSPTQSWLPLKTRVQKDGQPYCEETIDKLAQTKDGVWYPAKITMNQHFQPDPVISKTITITAFELKQRFEAGEFEQALPIGMDIVDHTTGRTWHNDPWWAEMEPWFHAKLNWPRSSMGVLNDMKSYVKEGIEGQPQPEMAAAKWWGERPAWKDGERKLSVLAFFGGRAIHPTPQWIAALKVLNERYGEEGLEILGIATATAEEKLVEQNYQMMQPGFPWAIDTKSETKGSFGKTFDAFKLQHYAGVLLIDAEGKVRSLETVQVPEGSKLSPIEFAIRQALGKNTENYEPPSDRLSDQETKQIDAEWKFRRNAKPGNGEIKGTVRINVQGRDMFGEVPVKETVANIKVRVRALPQMRVLHSDTPGGWTALVDYDHVVEQEFLAEEGLNLKGLRKGAYELSIRPDGLAAMETTVHLVSDDDTKELNLDFHQGDTITGHVVDADGKPIAGVSLKCPLRFFDPQRPKLHTNGNTPEPTTTDALGKFAFKALFAGAYQLEVTKEGYQPQTVSPVPAGKQGLKITLRKPGENEGVTQTGERPQMVVPCEVRDEADESPIPNVKLVWRFNHKDTKQEIWRQEFTSDAKGQYEVRLPASVVENSDLFVWLETEHRDYLPIRDSGFRIKWPNQPELAVEDFLKHMKLRRGREVTGRFIMPDGSPAKDMTVMIGDNRDGLEDGLGIGYYTQTDNDGKFRLLTINRWPQRISWFPTKHAANSKAITETFGDQGVIRISPGLKLTGKIVTNDGEPMPGVFVRATTGTRVPRRYAQSNERGEFTFDPLPAGSYTINAVRSVQDHHNHGSWEQVELPVPIPATAYELAANAKPLLIRAPETVRIRVKVVDDAGKPLSKERLAIGQMADYRNALIAKPVPNQAGEFEFQFPKGEYIRDLVLQHPWEEVAFYQEAPNKPFIPGSMLVLGKAEADLSGITIQVRKAGQVRLRIKTDTGGPMPENTNISTSYVNTYPDSKVQAESVVEMRSAKGEWSAELKQIVPDEPLKIEVRAPGYQPVTENVLLADGEVKTLDITLTPSDE